MKVRTMLVAFLLPVLCSCGGGGDGPVGPAEGEPYPLSSLQEVCDGALTGQDVLDRVMDGFYSATLTYIDRAGTTPLHVRVAYEGGAITCTPHRDPPPGSRSPSFPAKVSVEVNVDFATDDGAFQEALAAPLDGNFWGDLYLSTDFAAEDLGGTYDPNLPNHENVRVGIHGRFNGPMTAGHIGKGGQEPGKVRAGWFVATWEN